MIGYLAKVGISQNSKITVCSSKMTKNSKANNLCSVCPSPKFKMRKFDDVINFNEHIKAQIANFSDDVIA